jgi:hypothetical protein
MNESSRSDVNGEGVTKSRKSAGGALALQFARTKKRAIAKDVMLGERK